MILKISKKKRLRGIVKHSLHDITKRFNEYDIEIDNEIYKLRIIHFWEDIFGKLEGREIEFEGLIDTNKKEIINPVNIWIKLLKGNE